MTYTQRLSLMNVMFGLNLTNQEGWYVYVGAVLVILGSLGTILPSKQDMT